MGLFGKKQTEELPALSDRTIKFVAGELYGLIWSSAGEVSRNANPSHVAAIHEILRRHKTTDMTTTAHLIPDSKKGRITVEIDGKIIDQLAPESQAIVAGRVSSAVPVKCRIQSIGKGNFERCNVTLYHTK